MEVVEALTMGGMIRDHDGIDLSRVYDQEKISQLRCEKRNNY